MNKYEKACFDKRMYNALIKKPDIEIIKKCKCGNPVYFMVGDYTYDFFHYSGYHDDYVCCNCILDNYIPIGRNLIFMGNHFLSFKDKNDNILCDYHFYRNEKDCDVAHVDISILKNISSFLIGG